MSATVRIKRIAQASPRFKARIAGALYFLSLITAASGESIGGKMGIAAGEIAVAGMFAMTLLLYEIFKPVSRGLSLLAAACNIVGLAFEALRWNPRGVDIALVFVGLQHLLIAYMIFRSIFLPKILGPLMAFAGLGWLTYLSPPLADQLSPYNLASGLIGEGLVYLWILLMGVNVERWNEQAAAAGDWRTQRAMNA